MEKITFSNIVICRAERQQLRLNLEERTHELDKTQNELSTIRGVVEYNLGSLDAEKRYTLLELSSLMLYH